MRGSSVCSGTRRAKLDGRRASSAARLGNWNSPSVSIETNMDRLLSEWSVPTVNAVFSRSQRRTFTSWYDSSVCSSGLVRCPPNCRIWFVPVPPVGSALDTFTQARGRRVFGSFSSRRFV